MKLYRIMVVPIIFLIGLLIAGCGKKDNNQDEVVEYGKKNQAVYLVQMDINPSVIIGYDEDQIVVYLSSNNKDGYDLLKKYKCEDLIGKTFEATINSIITNAHEEGYDRQDFDVKVVSVGAKKADTKTAVEALGNAVKNCDFEVKVSVEVSENSKDKVDSSNTDITENVDNSGVICDACYGSGVIHCEAQVCLVCNGSGKQPCPRCNGGMWEENERSQVACLHCDGTGTQECIACAGFGKWNAWDEMCRGCCGLGIITDNPENKCPECGQKVEGELWYHVLLTHKGGKVCQECGKAQDDLELHTVRAHWDPAYYQFEYVKCPICDEMTKFSLEAHIKTHDNVEKCEICGAYYHQNGFEEHYLSAHNDLNLPQCSACGEHIYGDLEQHISQYHSNMQKCKHCDEYIMLDQIDFHNRTAHSEIYGPECPICHVHVVGGSLEWHMNLCHSHMVQCPICGEYVGTSLEDHNQKRHSE